MTRLLVLACLVVLLPEAAWAHTPIQGIGDFYSGVLHPWVVPQHILPIVALGLLLGQRGEEFFQAGLGSFLVAILLGLAAAGAGFQGIPEVVLLVLSTLEGVAVALAPPLPRSACVALAFATALLVALDSSPEASTLRATLMTLGGTAIGASLGLIYSGGLSRKLAAPWARIAVRVVGSWIAASSVLVLALATVGKAPAK
ncbi:MAG TPA: HupE/UreJ family protein [Candidatus Binatia bacterium]|jgi:urease accessory protein